MHCIGRKSTFQVKLACIFNGAVKAHKAPLMTYCCHDWEWKTHLKVMETQDSMLTLIQGHTMELKRCDHVYTEHLCVVNGFYNRGECLCRRSLPFYSLACIAASQRQHLATFAACLTDTKFVLYREESRQSKGQRTAYYQIHLHWSPSRRKIYL